MALIERLCQIDEDDPGGEPQERHIALNSFCEALFSVLGGYHTVTQIKGFFNMTAADIVEMDTLVSRITAHADDHERDRAVHRVRSILTFWELGEVAGYLTVADIRGKFNTI